MNSPIKDLVTITTIGVLTFALLCSNVYMNAQSVGLHAVGAHDFGTNFNGGGSAITTGNTIYFSLPYGCTVLAWNHTMEDGTDNNTCSACSITYKIWALHSTGALPTSANSLNTSGWTTTTTAGRSTTLSDLSSPIIQSNSRAAITITAVSGSPTKSSLLLECQ